MGGVPTRYKGGPKTYEALSPVVGGMLVEYVAGATSDASLAGCQPASANSAVVLGIATKDAVPYAQQQADSQGNTAYAGSFPTLDVSVPSPTVAVENDAIMGLVTYSAAATFRQPLQSTGNGQVGPATGTNPVIGWCAQVGGVAAGAQGDTRILV